MFLLFIVIYSLIVGAIFGSFVTALVYRHKHKLSMWSKHSVCPDCKHPLAAKDLLPIASYVAKRGKCAYCKAPIARRYIITELASVGVFVYLSLTLYTRFESALTTSPWWWLVLCAVFVIVVAVLLLALTVYDSYWGELPNIWTLGGAGLSLAMLVLAWWLDLPLLWQARYEFFPPSLWSGIASGLGAALFFGLIVILSEIILKKQGMGMGDVKLALFMGFFLGYPAIIVGLYIAFVFGAVLSLLLIAGKQKSFGTTLPFGPFMVLGWLASMAVGPAIVNWYSNLWL